MNVEQMYYSIAIISTAAFLITLAVFLILNDRQRTELKRARAGNDERDVHIWELMQQLERASMAENLWASRTKNQKEQYRQRKEQLKKEIQSVLNKY